MLLALGSACALWGATPDFSAKVVGASEGDAITVLRDNSIEIVNLAGIDAPENSQPFGPEAGKFLSGLAFGKTVTVRPSGVDEFGDAVAEVALPDGRRLAREMVQAGFAWWDPVAAPEDKALERLQSEAKAAKRGLWAGPNPVPPWEWENPLHVHVMNNSPGTAVGSTVSNRAARGNSPAVFGGGGGAYAPNRGPGNVNRQDSNKSGQRGGGGARGGGGGGLGGGGGNPRLNRRGGP